MAYRKRSGSGSKKALKEKVVLIYETFLKGEDPTIGNTNFWDELFLLKPKILLLETEILKLSPEQMQTAMQNIRLLTTQCIEAVGQEHSLRNLYALQTLCALVDSVCKKSRNDNKTDAVEILFGRENGEESMKHLLEHLNVLLMGDVPPGLKNLCLKLLLLLVTSSDDLGQNQFLQHAMTYCVFEELVQLLKVPASRVIHGHDVVLLLTLLVSYKKHEAANPYSVKLSILDDELALHGLGQVVASGLTDACRAYTAHHTDPPAGWLTSITSMVGSMFVSEESGKGPQLRGNSAALLALYEAVHLNRNFVAVLAHAQTDSGTLPSAAAPETSGSPAHAVSHPSTLLGTFFQYCSIVMQDTKSETSANIVKLCFFILTCITEDHYANALMHDANLVFHVQLHRLPMRHRKLAPDKQAPSQPLASTLHDLLVEFIMSHMLKKLLPLELYFLCVGVVHRLLCYQKRCCVRLNYQWKELWTALTTFLKFLIANENHLTKRMDIFEIAVHIVNIFNLFITYGDTFLPAPGCYDELYYEIIRMHQVFDDLYSMALRYSQTDGKHREHAMKLTNCLVNVRAIINHFSPKIEQWLANQGLSTPSEDQILELVRKNYDSLTLKLQDSLDQFERYSEKPRHVDFFQNMVRGVVTDSRTGLDYSAPDHSTITPEITPAS